MSIIKHIPERVATSKFTTVAVFVAIVVLLAATFTASLAAERTTKNEPGQKSTSADIRQGKDDGGEKSKMPENPVKRVAVKALRGEYGNLEDWQYKAYKYALAQDADVDGLAWVTSYGPWEGFMFGEACAYGYGCADSTAAANLLPAHYYVLIELPDGWEVRRIEDCGAKRNDGVARYKGAEVWIDRWVRSNEGSYITRYASIRAFKTW